MFDHDDALIVPINKTDDFKLDATVVSPRPTQVTVCVDDRHTSVTQRGERMCPANLVPSGRLCEPKPHLPSIESMIELIKRETSRMVTVPAHGGRWSGRAWPLEKSAQGYDDLLVA